MAKIRPGPLTPNETKELNEALDLTHRALITNAPRQDFGTGAQTWAFNPALEPDRVILAEITARNNTTGLYSWTEKEFTLDANTAISLSDKPGGMSGTDAAFPALELNGENVATNSIVVLRKGPWHVDYGNIFWMSRVASSGGGGTITTQEMIGNTPSISYSNVNTLLFAYDDGLDLSNPSAGSVKIDLLAAAYGQAGGVSISNQTFQGVKSFADGAEFASVTNNTSYTGNGVYLYHDVGRSNVTAAPTAVVTSTNNISSYADIWARRITLQNRDVSGGNTTAFDTAYSWIQSRYSANNSSAYYETGFEYAQPGVADPYTGYFSGLRVGNVGAVYGVHLVATNQGVFPSYALSKDGGNTIYAGTYSTFTAFTSGLGWYSHNMTGGILLSVSSANGPSLNDLHDVSISSPSDGEVLTYSGGSWINGSGGSNSSLPSASDGDIARFSSNSNTWVAESAGWSGSFTFMVDANTSSTATVVNGIITGVA